MVQILAQTAASLTEVFVSLFYPAKCQVIATTTSFQRFAIHHSSDILPSDTTLSNNNNNGYSALGPISQEPEPSQATGMTLIHCILGKFLGVVCHCFPPRLDVPTYAARCLHVLNDARDPSSERWNYVR
jgi:hypothetical protein